MPQAGQEPLRSQEEREGENASLRQVVNGAPLLPPRRRGPCWRGNTGEAEHLGKTWVAWAHVQP